MDPADRLALAHAPRQSPASAITHDKRQVTAAFGLPRLAGPCRAHFTTRPVAVTLD